MVRVALLFPGQGSQRVGMGASFAAASPRAAALFESASRLLGRDLLALCTHGPEDDLRVTMNTQPALFVCSCAARSMLREQWDGTPFAAAGHSVGEYAALVAAGVFDFETGLRLVDRRARLMQEAAEARPGTMAAVLGLDDGGVQAACDEGRRAGVVVVANLNCPGQVVISGEVPAVEAASEAARARGAKRVVPLAVSGGFHSPLMAAAGDALYPELREARARQPQFPVVANVTAEYCTHGVDVAPNLTMQISGTVRWERSIRRLLEDGVNAFVELGSGDVLAGLLRRIDRNARVVSVQDTETLAAAVAMLRDEAA
ncbi:MAG TPA: ACP S-malonyltransferase [Chthonomonadales bacterium]|nr:ACP S-malonyltransferase [Chthonomonadales bacterium]